MQMTYLLSQSAKKYKSALPEGSVSLDFAVVSLCPYAAFRMHVAKCMWLDTRVESEVFFWPVILFLDCGETQEASYAKSKFKIFKTGLPGQLETASAEESSPSVYAQHTPVGFLGV